MLSEMDTTLSPFNTAVFYDIENLLGGYRFNQQLAMNLSLREILNRIRQTETVGRMAVQRAYANWSDPRLGIFRKEINELGIEPVQVFGFAWDAKKNSADIQLAIDAVDLAHARPSIQTFVVVSGDGGFASLAKKLHEYGKTVIGAAYRKATNQTFHAVCDQFVWLEEPAMEEDASKPVKDTKFKDVSSAKAQTNKTNASVVAPPRSQPSPLQEILATTERLPACSSRQIVSDHVRKIILVMAKNPYFQRMLDKDGIPTVTLHECVRGTMDNFLPELFGFPRPLDFLRYACTGTKFQIARVPADNAKQLLIRRSRFEALTGWEALPDLAEVDLHSEEYYRHILRYRQPMIRVENSEGLLRLVQWLCENPPVDASPESILSKASENFTDDVTADTIKQGLFSFIHAGAFHRVPENVALYEQTLTLKKEWSTPFEMTSRLSNVAEEKITRLLGKIDEKILAAVF